MSIASNLLPTNAQGNVLMDRAWVPRWQHCLNPSRGRHDLLISLSTHIDSRSQRRNSYTMNPTTAERHI